MPSRPYPARRSFPTPLNPPAPTSASGRRVAALFQQRPYLIRIEALDQTPERLAPRKSCLSFGIDWLTALLPARRTHAGAWVLRQLIVGRLDLADTESGIDHVPMWLVYRQLLSPLESVVSRAGIELNGSQSSCAVPVPTGNQT